MMRTLFVIATGVFWLIVLGVGLASRFGGDPVGATLSAPVSAPNSAAPAYGLTEVARHATPTDCWMAIDGQVYALGAYLPDHPAREGTLEPWCGRDASEAYRTKLRGRAHSAAADRMLADYRIGQLKF